MTCYHLFFSYIPLHFSVLHNPECTYRDYILCLSHWSPLPTLCFPVNEIWRQDSYWIRREHSAPEPLNRKGFLPTTYLSLPYRPIHFWDSDLYPSLPLRSVVYWWSSIIMLLCVGIEKKKIRNEWGPQFKGKLTALLHPLSVHHATLYPQGEKVLLWFNRLYNMELLVISLSAGTSLFRCLLFLPHIKMCPKSWMQLAWEPPPSHHPC